ncbi:hypothetical protein BDV95DRAFT_628872 [Massariosphaeria phaeospora]|uniref:Protein kinase domain-containing protein n=1 Tax=Massariosphaeria phaeospora TaxID=100035 RepID=A0A7C8I9V1_9PLEO|nr:hypothetical protein BDV95DRAFT_628872 [Massariosphaeria phaeospora]
MRSFVRLSPRLANNSLLRNTPSLAPGHILPGARWNYHILDSVKGDNTHLSTVFKAEVVPHNNVNNAPQWAIIKAASPENTIATENLARERATYRFSGVSSAACFRQMYDVIDNNTIAVEWLDTTLAEVEYQPNMRMYALITKFLNAALASCIVLDGHRHVNTDYKPANILLSGIDTERVTAKVGDLVFPVGERAHAQPLAMRAPEVFLGQACTGPSQVWAVAAMLLCWIQPGILGASDSPSSWINEAWCMAKIKRLFPDWGIPTPDKVDGHVLQAVVKSARRMSRDESSMQAILPFGEEMQKVDMPQQLKEVLHFILVVNPAERPSASSMLGSSELQAFEQFVGV